MSRILPLFAVLALAIVGVIADPAQGPVAAQPAPGRDGHTAQGALTAAQQPAAIRIADFSFTPQRLSVPAGTTVTWTNRDNAAHTATATNGAFDSKRLAGGGAWFFTGRRR